MPIWHVGGNAHMRLRRVRAVTWLVACASLFATVMNIRRVRWCFAIWAFTNSAWAFYDFTHGLPAQGCLMTVYAGLAVWGFVAWGRKPGHA